MIRNMKEYQEIKNWGVKNIIIFHHEDVFMDHKFPFTGRDLVAFILKSNASWTKIGK